MDFLGSSSAILGFWTALFTARGAGNDDNQIEGPVGVIDVKCTGALTAVAPAWIPVVGTTDNKRGAEFKVLSLILVTSITLSTTASIQTRLTGLWTVSSSIIAPLFNILWSPRLTSTSDVFLFLFLPAGSFIFIWFLVVVKLSGSCDEIRVGSWGSKGGFCLKYHNS